MLDGDADAFLFAAGDDDKERQKRLIAEAKAENNPKPILFRHRRGSLQQVRRWIEEQQENGWGAFVSVQAMKAAKCQIAELAYVRVIYAEMDIGEPLKPWPIEPSLIVETSPGRYHVYWLVLAETPITADDFHGIMMRLVETYGSDPDAKDLARRLRLPGSWNLKPGREPHLVKVVHTTGARYPRDELLAAFPPPPRPEPRASAARPKFNAHTSPGLERFVGKVGDGPIWAISPDSYGDWLRVGMALHAETCGGADGLALWDRWSAASGSGKWAAGVCEEKWRSFGKRAGINGGTIFHMARERGWVEPARARRPSANGKATRNTEGKQHEDARQREEPKARSSRGVVFEPPGDIDWPEVVTKTKAPVSRSQANIRKFLDVSGVTLSYNAFTACPSFTFRGITRELDELVCNRLRLALHRAGANPSREFFESAMQDIALSNSHHPVLEYLDRLTWDGTPRLDKWLTTYLGAEDTPLNNAFGRCQLLAAVARVRTPGCKKDEMLILEGPQGIGKSTALRILALNFFTDALQIGQDSKEVLELTSGKWLVEFAEMEGMGKRESSAIKAMLSRQTDRARLAYGRGTTDRPRQFVCFGTVNDQTYLRDATGNRRFWPVRVGRIDRGALERDRDQIWAEASHRLAQGEAYELPEELWEAATKAQDARMLVSPWEMRLETALEGRAGKVPIDNIFAFLRIDVHRQNPEVGRALNGIMARLGWKKDQQRHPNRKTPSGESERVHCYSKAPTEGRSEWFSLAREEDTGWGRSDLS